MFKIAGVLLRKGDKIVLVRQRIESLNADLWMVPAGGVETGEDWVDAARREAQEETGLTPLGDPCLAYICEYDSRSDHFFCSVRMYVFDDFSGDLSPQDPDGEILEARLFTQAEALEHLSRVPWPTVREPMTVFLSDSQCPPLYWRYGADAQGVYRCLEKRPA
jgi:8-oxo-dGTP pyrophosphatase MutT (NUDIX family)